MTHALLLWLATVIAIGVVAATNPKRRQAVAFAIIAAATIAIPLAALGHPTPWRPAGTLTVLGVQVDVDKAIYVMVGGQSSGSEPRLIVLPYSEQAAQQLQEAQDGTADGEGRVVMTQGEDGSPGFAEEEAEGRNPPKNAEVPLL